MADLKHSPDPVPGIPRAGHGARKGEPGPAEGAKAGPGGTTSPQHSRERTAAEKPDPATGAAPSSRAAPGRGRASRTPAGTGTSPTSLRGDGTIPAGTKARAALTAPVSLADLQAAAMTEDRGPDSLDAHVRKLMKDLGLWGHHPWRSDKSEKGWPDWTILGTRIIYRELKSETGTLRPDQAKVRDRIVAAGGDWGLWRPSDLLSRRIHRELTAIAIPAFASATWTPA